MTMIDRKTLKRFLSQYYRAKEKQDALRKRLHFLQKELQYPDIRSPHMDQAPIEGRVSEGAAALPFKIAEIEDRIQRQIDIETKSVSDIMDVLDFLSADSVEKDILEYRHIDCKSWQEICDLVHLTRSPCFEHYNKALDMLLSYKKVRLTVEAYIEREKRSAQDSY